jgi:uncharacterized protein RhaS with RHS repeats
MYYRARYYNPRTARFLSEDPIGLAGGVNLYGYVDGDPVNSTDPLGLVKGEKKPIVNPNKRPPPEHRVPTGERQRNLKHEKGEEHSRRPKGGFKAPLLRCVPVPLILCPICPFLFPSGEGDDGA